MSDKIKNENSFWFKAAKSVESKQTGPESQEDKEDCVI